MTLAAVFFLIFWTASASPVAPHRPASQSGEKASQAASSQDQSGSSQAQAPADKNPLSSAAPPKTTPATPAKPAPKRPHHRKRELPPTCDSAAANPNAPASGQTATTPDTTTAGAAQNSKTPGAPANCPPSKVIVRQGGTSEPSIQLAGGNGGDHTSQQREAAIQLLAPTEENLKKIAGRQLDPSQQDMVSQIHQFMDQTKTAAAAGDMERARNLAWKAQLLSEELVKPAE